MKYLLLFEDFNQSEFPDVFDNHLLRGVKVDKDEYVDDPSTRKVRIGDMENDDYRAFLDNYTKLGLQDPTRSVHFYLNPSQKETGMMGYYGNTYRVVPEKDAKFSFCKELRNGGLGSTWYFVTRCLFDWLKLDLDVDSSRKLNPNLNYKKYFNDLNDLKQLSNLDELYNQNRQEFFRLITGYQQWLIDEGVVGNLTYQELLELANSNSEPIQIWTQSPVLHQKYEFKKIPKEPKPYKSKPLLNKSDFENLAIEASDIAEFYKSEIGKKVRILQDKMMDSSKFELFREEALKLLNRWNSQNQ